MVVGADRLKCSRLRHGEPVCAGLTRARCRSLTRCPGWFPEPSAGKLAAERAAKRVHGVRAVANDIEVRLRLERTDADIAQDTLRAFEVRSTIPESVQAAVHHGHITLTRTPM